MPKLPKLLFICVLCAACLIVPTLWILHRSHSITQADTDIVGRSYRSNRWRQGGRLGLAADDDPAKLRDFASPHLMGDVVMPRLPNATAKAELGRATWKFLHTMAQRFPEKPRSDEREALKQFLYLFSRLYPCGECATHFQAMLKEYPPQTSSRNAVSLYLCSLHNRVNVRLGKAEFDCSMLPENYDCGCGEPPVNGGEATIADGALADEHRDKLGNRLVEG